MSYKLVFDLARDHQPVLEALGGLAVVLLGALVVYRYPRAFAVAGHDRIVHRRTLTLIVLVAALTLWLVLATPRTALHARYARGDFQSVEGVVRDFVEMPASGHQLEQFTVNNTTFRYSDYVATPGFNNTRAHGGPIREGLQVRVGHIDGVIVRLEVLEQHP